MRSRLLPLAIFGLTFLSVWVNLPPINQIPFAEKLTGKFPIKLGLDLQGGTELTLQPQMDKLEAEEKNSALESARKVIERRVNLYGVSEAVVRSSKIGDDRRILVELPGVTDLSTAISLVGKTAQLEFRELVATPSAMMDASPSAAISLETTFPTNLTGADLKRAQVTFGGSGSQISGPQVAIEFTPAGAEKFTEITQKNIGKPLAIFLDNIPISAPTVQQEIIGGNAVITGQFSVEEAKNLAIQLNAGALPVPIKILHQRSIGPSLGAESINKSLVAGLIGLLTVAVYMVAYYGVYGLIADSALLIYSLLVLSIFRTGFFILPPVTLTLAGIAGFILSIGMAVDANILTFERMKEEKRVGKEGKAVLEAAFLRAWPSIRDSNISSLITAVLLYILGTSVVRGFAVTLFIGVMVSMFSVMVVSKTLLKFLPSLKR